MVRRFLAWLLGVLTGIILVVVAVVIVFFCIKVNTVTKLAGFDASKNDITADYADKTLYSALKSADKIVDEIKEKTVGDVAKSVKSVDDLLGSVENYEYMGVKIIDVTALKNTKLGELGSFDFSTIINEDGINNVKIGTILGYEYNEETGVWNNAEMMSAIEKALADKTISELNGDTLDSVVNGLKVGDILGADSSVMKLIPADTTVGNIDSAVQDAVKTKPVADLIDAGFVEISAENANKLSAVDVAQGKPVGYWKSLTCNGLVDYILGLIP